jgi:hypothetical protein
VGNCAMGADGIALLAPGSDAWAVRLVVGMHGVPAEHAAGICRRGCHSSFVMPSRYIRQGYISRPMTIVLRIFLIELWPRDKAMLLPLSEPSL